MHAEPIGQAAHVWPAAPHAPWVVPLWQTPLRQHPGQLLALQPVGWQRPLLQAVPWGQAAQREPAMPQLAFD